MTAVAPVVIQVILMLLVYFAHEPLNQSQGLWVGWPGPEMNEGEQIPQPDPQVSSCHESSSPS